MVPMVILWEAARSAGWQTFSEFIAAQLIPRRDMEGMNSCSFSLKPSPLRLSKVAQRVSEQLNSDGEEPSISVSIGIAVYPQDGRTIDALLGAADRALYRDKGTSKRKLRLSR